MWLAAIASLAFALSVLHGVPTLRQDWGTYPFHSSWQDVLSTGFSGWNPEGIGAPRPYPEAYLVSIPIALLEAIAGNHAALIVFLLGTAALCAFGARAIARDAGCGTAGVAGAVLFVTFNPWTYTELVAGHEFMLLAYGASLWFFREVLRERPRAAVLVACVVLCAQELQFLALCTIALVAIVLRSRRWQPLAIAGVVWLPSIVGIVADRGTLASLPLLLSWERSQSVSPVDALQLNGYFAHYGDAFRRFFACGPLDTLGVAFFAAVLPGRARTALPIAAATLLALVAATGTKGPLAGLYDWTATHVHAIGLYRELYDLLAYAAIGYALLAASLAGRNAIAAWFWALTALLLPAVWIVAPPDRFWVPAPRLPAVAVPAGENVRYALLPPFQPVSLDGRGGGADPDARVLAGNVTALNEYLAVYPADAALGAYARDGDARMLQALSVASVTARPWLRDSQEALAAQWALPFRALPRRSAGTVRLQPLPELSLLPPPAVGTLDTRLGSGDVFFADVPGAAPVVAVRAASEEVHASHGWVDARLAFAQEAALAQPFGGALTTEAGAALAVHDGLDALVYVDGSLRADGGGTLARTTHGYRWIAIPRGVRAVTCSGLCVVAVQGSPPRAPLQPPPHQARAVAFASAAPWLATATLPAGSAGAVRYNVGYDAGWIALLAGRRLAHLRLDGTVNGWLVPARSAPESLLLVHVPSLLQCLAEFSAIVVLACCGIVALRQGAR